MTGAEMSEFIKVENLTKVYDVVKKKKV